MLNALKNVAVANVNKVTLELGVKVVGKMRVPFVMEGNLKKLVEYFTKEMDDSKSG